MKEKPIEKYALILMVLADLFLLNRMNKTWADVFQTLFLAVYIFGRERILKDKQNSGRLLFVLLDLLILFVSSLQLFGPWLRLVLRHQSAQAAAYWRYLDAGELKPLFVAMAKMTVLSLSLLSQNSKGNRRALEISSFAIFVIADQLKAADGMWMKVWLIIYLVLLCVKNIDLTRKGNLAVLLVIVLFASWCAIALEPSIAAIKRPKSDDDTDNEWGIFDSDSEVYKYNENASRRIGIIDELLGTSMDNQAEPAQQDIVLQIRSSVPFNKIKAYNAGDYNMEKGAFELEDADDSEKGALYYSNAIFRAEEDVRLSLKERMDIFDYSGAFHLFMPYYNFAIYHDQVGAYKDRYLYFGIGEKREAYSYYFNPDAVYGYYAQDYLDYAEEKYLTLDPKMEESLKAWLKENGLKEERSVRETLYALHRYLIDNTEYAVRDAISAEDPVLDFLSTRKGSIKRFAAAETLLLRALHIPARYTFGYQITHWRDNMAYALQSNQTAYCEVFYENRWQVLEDLLVRLNYPYLHFGPDPQMVIEMSEKPEETDYPKEDKGAILEPDSPRISHVGIDREQAKTVLRVDCAERIALLRAYSCGDYDTEKAAFLREEEIAEELKENSIDALEELIRNRALTEENREYKALKVENTGAPGWLYAPYGLVQDEGYGLYQDKYLTVSDPSVFDGYVLHYVSSNEEEKAPESYDAYVHSHYLRLDEKMKESLTDFLISRHIDTNDSDKNALINRIRQLFKSEYVYTLDMPEIPADQDPVLYFLTVSKKGYCQHFAAAMTLLLRVCNIPARYTVGYLGPFVPHQINEVSSLQAHSWVEIYTAEGWKSLEASLGRDENNDIRITGSDKEADYVFPAEKIQKDSHLYLILLALALAAILFGYKPLSSFLGRFVPTILQEINGSYLLLKKHHYLNEEIEKTMLRIRYSPDKENEKDRQLLRLRRRQVRNIYLLNHRYGKWLGFVLEEKKFLFMAFVQNLIGHFEKGSNARTA